MSIAGTKWVSQPFQRPALLTRDWWGCFCAPAQGQHHVEIAEGSTTWFLPAHVRRLAAQDFIIRDGDTEMAAVTANPYAFKAGDCIQLIDADTEEEFLTIRWDDSHVARIRRKGRTVAHVARDQSQYANDTWNVFHGECRTRDFNRLIGSDDHLLSLLAGDGEDGNTHVYKGDENHTDLVAETFRLGSHNDFMEYEVRVNNGCDIALVLAALVAKDSDMDRTTMEGMHRAVREVINTTRSCECGTLLCPPGRNSNSAYLKGNPEVRAGSSRSNGYRPPQDSGRFNQADEFDDYGEDDRSRMRNPRADDPEEDRYHRDLAAQPRGGLRRGPPPRGGRGQALPSPRNPRAVRRAGSFQDAEPLSRDFALEGGASSSSASRRGGAQGGAPGQVKDAEVGTCPVGHVLKPIKAKLDGYMCDVCLKEFKRGASLYHCEPCSYDKCEDCHSSAIRNNRQQQVSYEVSDLRGNPSGKVGTCPLGHHLKPFVTDISGYQCSHCNRESMRGNKIYQCASCSYDMCESCYFHGIQQISLTRPKATNSVTCGDSELPIVELRTGVQHYLDRLYCLRGVPSALHGAQLVKTPWQAGGMDFRIMVGDCTVCVLLAHGAKSDYPSGADELESQLRRLSFSKVVLHEMRTDSFPGSGVDLWRRPVDSRIVLSIRTNSDIEFNICFIDSEMDQAMVRLRDNSGMYGNPQAADSHGHGGRRDRKTTFAARAETQQVAARPQTYMNGMDDDGSDDDYVGMPREMTADSRQDDRPPPRSADRARPAPPPPRLAEDDRPPPRAADRGRPAPPPPRLATDRAHQNQPHHGYDRDDDEESSRSQDSSPDLPGGRLLTPRPPDGIVFNQDEIHSFRETGRTVDY